MAERVVGVAVCCWHRWFTMAPVWFAWDAFVSFSMAAVKLADLLAELVFFFHNCRPNSVFVEDCGSRRTRWWPGLGEGRGEGGRRGTGVPATPAQRTRTSEHAHTHVCPMGLRVPARPSFGSSPGFTLMFFVMRQVFCRTAVCTRSGSLSDNMMATYTCVVASCCCVHSRVPRLEHSFAVDDDIELISCGSACPANLPAALDGLLQKYNGTIPVWLPSVSTCGGPDQTIRI